MELGRKASATRAATTGATATAAAAARAPQPRPPPAPDPLGRWPAAPAHGGLWPALPWAPRLLLPVRQVVAGAPGSDAAASPRCPCMPFPFVCFQPGLERLNRFHTARQQWSTGGAGQRSPYQAQRAQRPCLALPCLVGGEGPQKIRLAHSATCLICPIASLLPCHRECAPKPYCWPPWPWPWPRPPPLPPTA